MQVNISSNLNIVHRNNEKASHDTDNMIHLNLSRGDGYKQYVHAMEDGYIEVDGVKLTVSEEAKKELEKKYNQWHEQQEKLNEIAMANNNAKWARQTGEAYQYAMKNQAAALEIARRISKGGKVPASDERKLMEYDDKLYQMAKQAYMMAKEHKKHKDSLFDQIEKPEIDGSMEEPELLDLELEIPSEIVAEEE